MIESNGINKVMNYRRNTKKINKFFPRNKPVTVRRGDLYYADLSNATIGSEQGGTRPVLIIQNDMGNRHSPTVIVAAITSQNKRGLPTHIELLDESFGLSKNSTIMLEQVRTIDKARLRDKIGHLDKEIMDKVDKAIFISFGIDTDLANRDVAEDVESLTATFEQEESVNIRRRKTMRKHKGDLTKKLFKNSR